jgi:uncharacterized protein YeaO (DUF488 family)
MNSKTALSQIGYGGSPTTAPRFSKIRMLQLKRVYEKPAKKDGQRILVERLWPRGLSKGRAAIDLWMKDLAPSPQLRQWFAHDPAKWEQFQQRYWKELGQHPEAVDQLRKMSKRRRVTLVYAARDEQHNGALALKTFIERRTTAMKKKSSQTEGKADAAASELIDGRIKELGDWRGKTLAQIRALIKHADPDVVEEWKWRGVPVWSHAGIICTGETYAKVVKLTFAKGASLKDPSGLFNSSLEGNTRRAIDIHEGEMINEKAFKALIRAAVALNTAPRATARAVRSR